MNNYIYHHGVKGMHWGVRKYQNYEGNNSVKKVLKTYSNSDFNKKYEKRGASHSIGRNALGVVGHNFVRSFLAGAGLAGAAVAFKLPATGVGIKVAQRMLGTAITGMTVAEITSRYSGYRNDRKTFKQQWR